MKRVKRQQVQRYLDKSSFELVLEVGCGPNPWKQSTHLIDCRDFSKECSGRKFIVQDLNQNLILPYGDREVDFLICVQNLEHIIDCGTLLDEFSRVAKSGYLEVPGRIIDNLLSIDGDPYGHKWWFSWDDNCQSLLIEHRQRVTPLISHQQFRSLGLDNFRDELDLCIQWEGAIAWKMLRGVDLKII